MFETTATVYYYWYIRDWSLASECRCTTHPVHRILTTFPLSCTNIPPRRKGIDTLQKLQQQYMIPPNDPNLK